MLSEIERGPEEPLVSGDTRLVLEWPDDVEGHLNLEQAFVEINRGAIWVKPRPCREEIILGRSYSPFRSVWVFHVW
jgi:hypothetical protein